jgi:hypothetical protein
MAATMLAIHTTTRFDMGPHRRTGLAIDVARMRSLEVRPFCNLISLIILWVAAQVRMSFINDSLSTDYFQGLQSPLVPPSYLVVLQ